MTLRSARNCLEISRSTKFKGILEDSVKTNCSKDSYNAQISILPDSECLYFSKATQFLWSMTVLGRPQKKKSILLPMHVPHIYTSGHHGPRRRISSTADAADPSSRSAGIIRWKIRCYSLSSCCQGGNYKNVHALHFSILTTKWTKNMRRISSSKALIVTFFKDLFESTTHTQLRPMPLQCRRFLLSFTTTYSLRTNRGIWVFSRCEVEGVWRATN